MGKGRLVGNSPAPFFCKQKKARKTMPQSEVVVFWGIFDAKIGVSVQMTPTSLIWRLRIEFVKKVFVFNELDT